MSDEPKLDEMGHLADPSAWDETVACRLAGDLRLSDEHWQILRTLRAFYEETDVAPAMRPFVKLIADRVGADSGNSIRLMTLFGESPAREAARIAGLPKPTNCL